MFNSQQNVHSIIHVDSEDSEDSEDSVDSVDSEDSEDSEDSVDSDSSETGRISRSGTKTSVVVPLSSQTTENNLATMGTYILFSSTFTS